MERAREAEKVARALAVERERHAIPGCGAERTEVVQPVGGLEVLGLVEEHLGVPRRPHAHRRRHGGLQVRAPHERHAVVGLAEIHERPGERAQLVLKPEQLVLDVQAYVHGHLVVAAATGVDLLPEIAQRLGETPLHGHVDVLVGLLDGKVACLRGGDHLRELRAHARRLVLRHDGRLHRHLRKHRHVRRRAHAVPRRQLPVQHGVVAHRVGEDVRIDRTVCYRLFRLHFFCSSSIAFIFPSAASRSGLSSSADFPCAAATRNVL